MADPSPEKQQREIDRVAQLTGYSAQFIGQSVIYYQSQGFSFVTAVRLVELQLKGELD